MAEPESSGGSALNRRWHGIPVWMLAAGGGILLVVGYRFYKAKQAANSSTGSTTSTVGLPAGYTAPLPGYSVAPNFPSSHSSPIQVRRGHWKPPSTAPVSTGATLPNPALLGQVTTNPSTLGTTMANGYVSTIPAGISGPIQYNPNGTISPYVPPAAGTPGTVTNPATGQTFMPLYPGLGG